MTKQILLAGETKPKPFTVLIVANPRLEAPRGSIQFISDPILTDEPLFDRVAAYIVQSLVGNLPGQEERLFDPPSAVRLRVVSFFDAALEDSHSLVAQDSVSFQLIGRTQALPTVLATIGEAYADVVFAVSASATHTRSTAWFTQDDDTRAGVSFTYDGATLTHRHWNVVPGLVSLHSSADALTALHEFQHAISSYTNGIIIDLYVDGTAAANRKAGRPIPINFCNHNGANVAADLLRAGVPGGYPAVWTSFHPEQHDNTRPSVMDNYYQAVVPNSCQNDRLTRQFITDRIRAKMAR